MQPTKYLIIFWLISTSRLLTIFTPPTWWWHADFLRFPLQVIHQTLSRRLTTSEKETTFTSDGSGQGVHEKTINIEPNICNLRLDMRNFTLSSKAGCLVDSFQIITSEQTNLHHHQAQAAALTRLCGERRKTTVIVPVTSDNLVTLKFQIKSGKAEWFMDIKQEPCQKSIAQKIDVLTDRINCKTTQTKKILKRTFVQQRKIIHCQEESKSIISKIWRFIRPILGFLPDTTCDFFHTDKRGRNRIPEKKDLLKIVGHKSHHVPKDFFKIVQKSSMKPSSQNLSQSKQINKGSQLKEKDSHHECQVFLFENNKFTCLCS